MGYFYLLIALLAGVTKGFCGKKTSKYTSTTIAAVNVSTFRMFLCVVISAFIFVIGNGSVNLSVSPKVLGICVLSGVSMSAFVLSWLMAVRKGAYMTVDVSLTAGIVIPIVLCSVLWGEKVEVTQWLGLLLLFVSVIIMCSYNKSLNGKLSASALVLLIVCGVSNGIADFSQKLFVKIGDGADITLFNFYTYLVSTLVLFIFSLVLPKTQENKTECSRRESAIMLCYITVMSACMFLNVYFKTKAAASLDSVLLYPLNQGGALFLSSFMSATLFHEKITARAATGILLAFAALIIINVL